MNQFESVLVELDQLHESFKNNSSSESNVEPWKSFLVQLKSKTKSFLTDVEEIEKFQSFRDKINSNVGHYTFSDKPLTQFAKDQGYSERVLDAVFDVRYYERSGSDQVINEFTFDSKQPEWAKNLITQKLYDSFFDRCSDLDLEYTEDDACEPGWEGTAEGYNCRSYFYVYIQYPVVTSMPKDDTQFLSIENHKRNVKHYKIDEQCLYEIDKNNDQKFICDEKDWFNVWGDAPVIIETDPMEPETDDEPYTFHF